MRRHAILAAVALLGFAAGCGGGSDGTPGLQATIKAVCRNYEACLRDHSDTFEQTCIILTNDCLDRSRQAGNNLDEAQIDGAAECSGTPVASPDDPACPAIIDCYAAEPCPASHAG